MHTKDIAIGLDIGGTKMKCGIVDCGGNLLSTPREILTNAQGPREKIVANILELLNESLSQVPSERLVGIGIGCTGPLDINTGTILKCNTLPTMHNYPLKHILELTTGRDVRMNNDANAMMLGEALWGVGKGRKSILGLTLGTGFGCAYVQEGHILIGSTSNAGEIWQAPYRDGHIEEYVSGTALSRMYRLITNKDLNGKEVAERARDGEKEALDVFRQFSDGLTFALAWTLNTVDPDLVVIGGSVVDSIDLFLPRVKEQLPRYLSEEAANHIEIVPASLGDNAGFMGAAALMFK